MAALINARSDKTLLYFWAEWHEPSKGMIEMMDAVGSKYPSIDIQCIEAEASIDLSSKYNVHVVPTFITLHHNEIIERHEGVNHSHVIAMVKRLSDMTSSNTSSHTHNTHTSTTTTSSTSAPPSTSQGASLSSEMKEKLSKLVFSHQVMLFIKGTPDA
jgi:thiol-disulfide isomerase/thioredoxin